MEPISIGGQQFIKGPKGWIDKKSKAPAGDELSKILDSALAQLNPEETPAEKIETDDTKKALDEIRSALKRLSALFTHSDDIPITPPAKSNDLTPPKAPLRKSIKPLAFNKSPSGNSNDGGFLRKILSDASPFIAKNIYSALDKNKSTEKTTSKSSAENAIEKKRQKKNSDNSDKIVSLLSKIDKSLSKLGSTEKTSESVKETVKETVKELSKDVDRNLKPENSKSGQDKTYRGKTGILSNIGSNLRGGILGERDKETGQLIKTGFLRDVISEASPFVGRNLLNARDAARENRLFNKSNLIGQLSNVVDTNLGPEYKDETSFEKNAEAASQREVVQSVIVSDFSSGALDKLKTVLAQPENTNNQNKNSPEGQSEAKQSGLESISGLLGRAGGLLTSGLGGIATKAGRLLGVKPSIKGLRENAAGKVIDQSGRFVSAERSQLFKAAQAAEKTKDVADASKVAGTLVKGAGEKVGIKGVTKLGAKSLVKKIPIIGLGAGLAFGASKLIGGDPVGAGLEVASGAASLIPGVGTAASLGLDAGIAARDAGVFSKPETPQIAPTSISKTEKPTEKTIAFSNASKQVAQTKERAAVIKPQPAPVIAPQSSTVVNNTTKQNMMNVPTVPDRGSLGKIKY